MRMDRRAGLLCKPMLSALELFSDCVVQTYQYRSSSSSAGYVSCPLSSITETSPGYSFYFANPGSDYVGYVLEKITKSGSTYSKTRLRSSEHYYGTSIYQNTNLRASTRFGEMIIFKFPTLDADAVDAKLLSMNISIKADYAKSDFTLGYVTWANASLNSNAVYFVGAPKARVYASLFAGSDVQTPIVTAGYAASLATYSTGYRLGDNSNTAIEVGAGTIIEML